MARPSVAHDGFLIGHPADVVNARMSEPDRIDFNTLANANFGVVTGCLVTVSGTTASTLGGIAVVAGVRVDVPAASVSLSTGGSLDRFDLVGVDSGGTLRVVGGTPATDPVFPDPPTSFLTLGAVFAGAGTSNFSDTITDKRIFLPRSLISDKLLSSDVLVQTRAAAASPTFTVFGDGRQEWGANDTAMWRVNTASLRIKNYLDVLLGLTVGADGIFTSGNVTANGFIQGQNLQISGSLPGTATTGTIHVNLSSGKIHVRQSGAWQELATVAGAVPPGTIIDSVRPPSEMIALGWVPYDGRTVQESEYPTLFTMNTGGTVTGVAPNRSMVMPNLADRFRKTSFGPPGQMGGSNTKSLSMANMPQHKHDVATQQGGGGPLAIQISQGGVHNHGVSGGEHSHPVNDPGHAHNGTDYFGNAAPIIAVTWGGRNKIDALFNDRNHTYSVEAHQWITPALTGISVSAAGSSHGHVLGDHPGHTHPATVSDAPAHTHPVTEQERGLGTAFDVSPAHMTVYTYIRS